MSARIKWVLAFLALSALVIYAQKKISDYPNTATAQGTDLFILARPGVTNLNISYTQLENQLLTNNYWSLQGTNLEASTSIIVDYDINASNGIHCAHLGVGTLTNASSMVLQVGQGSDVQATAKVGIVGGDLGLDGGGAFRSPTIYFRFVSGAATIKSDGALAFSANNLEKARILTTGYFGVGTTVPNSLFHVAGPTATSVQIGGSCTLSDTNSFYGLNENAGNVTNLSAVGKSGRIQTVKLISPATTGTIYCDGSQLIDGSPSYSLSASNKFVTYLSDGTNWLIIGNN